MKTAVVGTAPGKVILFGEHAVVYGQPAIAVPVQQVRAMVTVTPGKAGAGVTLVAADLDRVVALTQAGADDPLAAVTRLVLARLNVPPPDVTLTIRSTIPIASGMGSGAAVSTAIVRALASFVGRDMAAEGISELVYEVERLHHGTPSGIDNTVVTYAKPVYFVRGRSIETLRVGAPLHLVIGDTGVQSPTRVAVGDVRRAWERNASHLERLFEQVGAVARQARGYIEVGGEETALGRLMDRNHALLREMGVSSPELERLVKAARSAGALGAKLSGAGRGGNMIALVTSGEASRVAGALHRAGAVRRIMTVVSA